MPYYHFDAADFGEFEEIEEIVEESMAASDAAPPVFTYSAQDGSFEIAALDATDRATISLLQGIGATGFKASYDGGYDEGFAHFQTALLPEGPVSLDDLVGRLTGPAGMDAAEAPELLARRLDNLATTLATLFLGQGFGTGEYSLYGAFEAEFATGTIIDDPDAEKPEFDF